MQQDTQSVNVLTFSSVLKHYRQRSLLIWYSLHVQAWQSCKMTSIARLPRDPNTLSNYSSFLTTHTDANCTIKFDQQVVVSKVVLTLKCISAAQEIILDTAHLNVHDVKVDGEVSRFELRKSFHPYGRALRIPIDQDVKIGQRIGVSIDCATTSECTAIQFMTPTQARSNHPYMFSQCQV